MSQVLNSANEMDLSIIREQAQEEAWLTIQHPVTGVETTMRLRLLSPDSERYRALSNRLLNSKVRAITRGSQLSVEESSENALHLLVQATTAWEGVIFGGQPLEFSPENVKTVYSDFPFIREQVDRFIGDRRNFFQS